MPVSFTKLFVSLFALIIAVSYIVTWGTRDRFRRATVCLLILLMIPSAALLWFLLEVISDRLGLWWL
jgi:hypothetical protein